MSGWEWPDPGKPTCGDPAEERATGERFYCNLALGHRDHMHHWQEVPRDGQIRSCTWIKDGPVTFVGAALDRHTHQDSP